MKKPTRAVALMVTYAIVFAALAVGALINLSSAPGRRDSKPDKGHEASRVLVEQQVDVVNSEWRSLNFELRNQTAVTFEFQVAKGEGVTAYLIKETDLSRFKEVVDSKQGSFRHFSAFTARLRRDHSAQGTLEAGTYLAMFKEGSSPTPEGAVERAPVHVRITGR